MEVWVLKTQYDYDEAEVSLFSEKPTYDDLKNTGVVPTKFIDKLLENNYLFLTGSEDFEDDETDDNWIYNNLIGCDTSMRISLECYDVVENKGE